ncbi:MAG: hypothetical protein WBC51_17150 [Vicinamibacterales bacterium]
MTPLREAFLLPGVFLTVTLLGGLRVADTVRLVPPTLTAVVLAVILITAIVRSGVFLPSALLDSDRRAVENLNGAVVLFTLLAASAQVMSLVVPERGLLHFLFAVFLFVQLLSLSAARIDRPGMLRSLFVLIGAAFILRFIILESLYATDSGSLKRVLTALMSGVTLGGIEYQPHAAMTGYVAFICLALYMTGLVLLPPRALPSKTAMTRTVESGPLTPVLLVVLAVSLSACRSEADPMSGPSHATGRNGRDHATDIREAALASARVWMSPPVPPAAADLAVNPEPHEGLFSEQTDVECRFALEKVGGLTPKFNCQLPDGRIVKVKYGVANPELYAEVAATRLVAALGFPADRMYVVRGVNCGGCPQFPYHALRCHAMTGARWPCFPTGVDFDQPMRFAPAVIEQRLEGRRIEASSDQGWAWYELDKIDRDKGGSSRPEVDSLRLLAVFLAHWDNKAENQRLVCPPGSDLPDGGCARPLAMVQDLGSTFGPTKLDLHNWRTTPVWSDPRACRVTMEQLPYHGGTFEARTISEEGRQFLLTLIEQFSRDQIESLFASARAPEYEAIRAENRSPHAWAVAFEEKVQQIRAAGPCPD